MCTVPVDTGTSSLSDDRNSSPVGAANEPVRESGSLQKEKDCTVSCLCEQRRQLLHVNIVIDSHEEQPVPELHTLSEDAHPCKVEEMECVVKQLFEA
ncbi:Microtubule cross-linking factor [Trichinella pseudospiralis]